MTELCPTCKNPLKKLRYPINSYLNRDQWELVRAGDFYCNICPSNGRGNKPLCYWWKHEVKKEEDNKMDNNKETHKCDESEQVGLCGCSSRHVGMCGKCGTIRVESKTEEIIHKRPNYEIAEIAEPNIVHIELNPCNACSAKYSQILRKNEHIVESPWEMYCNSCGRNNAEVHGKSKADVVAKWNEKNERS